MKINKKNKIAKNNSLLFIFNGMKKNFLYILIIFTAIITVLPFNINLAQKNIALAADECTIVSAGWNPSGEQSDNFFKEEQTNADIVIKTKNCANYPDITFSVYETDGLALDDPLTDSGLYEKRIIIPTDNFTIKIMLGEEVCEAGPGFDCNLYFKINKDGNVIYQSLNKPSGNLFYECEGVCLSNGRFIEILSQGSDEKPITVTPQKASGSDDTKSGVYKLLAPIGSLTEAPENMGDYFNTIFLIAIGLCGVLAVIMIVIGGIQYMGDESVFGKTDAKDRITKAILGLLIALGSYALLNTINPDLLGKGGIKINSVSAEISGDTDAPIGGKEALPSGIVCSGGKINLSNIVTSFTDKMTYEMGAKGVAGPNNTIKLDCSGFVNYVLKCADIPFINGGTASIFSNAEKVTTLSGAMVNDKVLSMGDLVGWRAGENGEKYGHVMVYIGSGQIIVADSHGGAAIGKALGKFPISKYKDRIKYIKRAP